MKIFLTSLLIIFLSMVFIGCDDDNVTNNDEDIAHDGDLVKVYIDLQGGFGQNLVEIEFNSEEYLRAAIYNINPMVGPNASFTSYLPRGKNHFNINWKPWESLNDPGNEDNGDFTIGDADYYYLGIMANGPDIIITIQEESFGYF